MIGLLLSVLFKDTFFSQKAAYYAQVEARASMKNETANIRHYALYVTANFKCEELFKFLHEYYQKKLKGFPHERQIKLTSTVKKAPSPFHALVKLC